MSDKKLFSEFPPVTSEQWEAQISTDLKGADYEKKLVWRSNEGFSVRPYYRSENLDDLQYLNVLPGEFPYVRGKNREANDWQVRQDICVGDIPEANAKALDALSKGADSVCFDFCEKGRERDIDVAALLKGVNIETCPIHFDAGVNSVSVLEGFIKAGGKRGSVFFDPLGRLASCGSFYKKTEFSVETLKKLLELAGKSEDLRVIGIDASQFQNAGASAVQELACALSMGSEYLSLMAEAGESTENVASHMQFKFAVGSNYFMEIAKIRAARLLWANIVKAYGGSEKAAYMFIHGETADWNMTLYDPHVNMLRTTTEAMSAAIAGVDSLSVQPFDGAYRKSDTFSERIARNQQIILKEESYMSKIVDPSAGSYYIENLTSSIADNAWKLFLETEDRGGYTAAMKEGVIQAQVKASADKRRAAVASRKEILLGTNQYANPGEMMKDRAKDCSFGKHSCDCPKVAEPIEVFRLSETFETLRLRTENSGRRPKVFLLTIGNLTMRKARAGFASNFFSVAGFEVMDNNGFNSVEEGVDAAVKAKADIIVLCSSDDEYPELVPKAVEAAKGKAILVLAGYPKAIIDDLKAAGMENFIYAGQNVPEALTEYQNKLKI
jgi:methylmalonyl-CoA mutase